MKHDRKATSRLLIAVLRQELTLYAATQQLDLSDSSLTGTRFFRLIEEALKANPKLKDQLINSLQR